MVQARIILRTESARRKLKQVVRVSETRLVPEAKRRTVIRLKMFNKVLTPRGATGELQESFYTEEKPNTITFGWTAPHARYVDEGTPESPGRYIPQIGKRYRTDDSKLRDYVFRKAERKVKIGHKRYIRKLESQIERLSTPPEKGLYDELLTDTRKWLRKAREEGPTVLPRLREAVYGTRMYTGVAARRSLRYEERVEKDVPGSILGLYVPKGSRIFEKPEHMRHRRTAPKVRKPRILIRTGQEARIDGKKLLIRRPKSTIVSTKVHELWHAAQFAVMGSTGGYGFTGVEPEAYKTASDFMRRIGTHPGTRPQRYIDRMMEKAVDSARVSTLEVFAEEVKTR
jgi:plasmid stabilization system protein ParE